MSTRQAPGPSMVPLAPSLNSRKRSTMEASADIDNSRSLKKSKRDDSTKDKKKRQRKKKRKLSVATAIELDFRSRSKSRSATVTTQDSAQEEIGVMPENVLAEEAQPLQDPPDAPDLEDASPRIPYGDKGKGKAKEESLPPIVESPESQIARLQQELEAQRLLLSQHQSHLAQVHQALTCQICLDLLHKPFALAPCGHIVCYSCLVRWFTAPEAPNEPHSLQEDIIGLPETSHYHKKKKCPVCRTHIMERPVEVWGVKSMVAGLVRSGLIELPAPVPALEPEASTSSHDDPWRNIFRRVNRMFLDLLEPRPPRPPRPGGEGLQEMGMYDADDGGIYRCIDCMHEILRGVCTHCNREYPGHRASEDDEDDEDLEFDAGEEFRDILQMFANGPNAYLGDDVAYTDSDSEHSAGFIFGEEIDDEEENNLLDMLRAPNLAVPGTLGRLYRNTFDEVFPTGRFERAHEFQVDESGDERDEFEGSVIDDSEASSAELPPSRFSRSTRPVRRRYFSDDSDEESDVEVVMTEGATRQLGRELRSRRRTSNHGVEGSVIDDSEASSAEPPPSRFSRSTRPVRRRYLSDDSDEESDVEVVMMEGATRQRGRELRSRRRTSNHGSVQSSIMMSDDDEGLSPPPSRTATRRTRTIIDLSDNSENENFLGEDNDDDVDDVDDVDNDNARTYEEDGSRSGPSSRLLRLMRETDDETD